MAPLLDAQAPPAGAHAPRTDRQAGLAGADATRADVHQHIWTRTLLDALAARDAPPLVRRDHGQTVLHAAGETPYVITEESEAPARRAELLRADGLHLAIVAPSSPIGIEALPRPEAREMIAAHLAGVSSLPPQFLHWGPLALDRPDQADVDELASAGCAGVALAAGALGGRASLEAVGPLLERAAARRLPVFIHPGAGDRSKAHGPPESPWWPALTDYVAQMQAAWITFAAYGRAAHPELTVVFAMLAGGAPLLAERLAARGGPDVELRDPATFYDTSSYGPTAVEMMARIVGPDQLVYGSDRPVAEPLKTGRERLLQESAGRLLARLGTQVALETAR